jgi:hypothetical protein
MKRYVTYPFVLLLAIFGFSGCMVSGGLIIEPEPIIIGDPPDRVVHKTKRPPRAKSQAFRVPPGHMPPRGMCRIWYNDRPPGHQPPAVSCNRIRRVPYGAVVVRG